MISIITPIYNTNKEILARTWASLKAQTFKDWEWVVWDDSTNNNAWSQVYGFASDERFKIALYKPHVHSGNIGYIKHQAFMLASGDILVELDHDDELTSDCLEEIYNAFQNPEIGFVFSNWCEINEHGQSCRYPEGWGFGYGSDYWDETHNVWTMKSPELNSVTISHIVSMPNHVRAWRASIYKELNGHSDKYEVADDYELMVRTVLYTKYKHIDKLLYKQYINSGTAQRTRNTLIQQLVAEISSKYKDQFHLMDKVVELK